MTLLDEIKNFPDKTIAKRVFREVASNLFKEDFGANTFENYYNNAAEIILAYSIKQGLEDPGINEINTLFEIKMTSLFEIKMTEDCNYSYIKDFTKEIISSVSN